MTLDISLVDEALPPPCPPRFNLAAHALAPSARRTPGKVALTVAGPEGEAIETWTCARLWDAVRRTAGGLRAAGLGPGDRLLLRVGNTADFPVLFLGAIAAGGVAVPTSAQLSPREVALIARDVAPRLACVSDDLGVDLDVEVLGDARIARLRAADPVEPAPTRADDPAFAVYTSGSSGRPKGVIHAHRAGWARRMMWRGWYGLTAADVMLHAGAFNWTYTLGAGLLDPWAAGASTVVYAGPRDPGVWPRIAAARGATLFAATPGVLRQLLKYGEGVGGGMATVRHALSAGEKLPEALRGSWRAETGRAVHEALGMSEVSTYVSSSPETPARAGFAGRPQPGRRVAVLERGTARPAPVGAVGELAVSRRDPGLMLGYRGRAEETAAAFRGEWFVTGDLAEMDAGGYVAYRGRADDLMNAGGHRVSPQEVEDVLLAHPAVRECAAVELPVRADVTVVAVFAVADADPDVLRAWCAGRLAAYKVPRRVEIVEALPRTPTGKVVRRRLIERYGAG